MDTAVGAAKITLDRWSWIGVALVVEVVVAVASIGKTLVVVVLGRVEDVHVEFGSTVGVGTPLRPAGASSSKELFFRRF